MTVLFPKIYYPGRLLFRHFQYVITNFVPLWGRARGEKKSPLSGTSSRAAENKSSRWSGQLLRPAAYQISHQSRSVTEHKYWDIVLIGHRGLGPTTEKKIRPSILTKGESGSFVVLPSRELVNRDNSFIHIFFVCSKCQSYFDSLKTAINYRLSIHKLTPLFQQQTNWKLKGKNVKWALYRDKFIFITDFLIIAE